jgi:hypothetical protein
MSTPQPAQESSSLNQTVSVVSAALVALFLAAELSLLIAIAGVLSRGLTGPALLIALRASSRRAVASLQVQSVPLVSQLIREAARNGVAFADSVTDGVDVARLPLPGWFDPNVGGPDNSVDALIVDLDNKLRSVSNRISRYPEDVYRRVSAVSTNIIDGGPNFRQAQAAAWSDLRRQGVTGFVDSAGRSWSLSTYVEMAVRTSTQRAYNAAHLERMVAAGIVLFTVSDSGRPCMLCLPWQGKVLTVGPNMDPTFSADASVAEATAAGLFHPNCQHVLLPFFPGVTKLGVRGVWDGANEKRYKDSQRQRALERNVRAAKRDLAGVTDLESVAKARASIRNAQKAVRDFIGPAGLDRRSDREQVDLGY